MNRNVNKHNVIVNKFDYFDDIDDNEEQQDSVYVNNQLDEEIDPLDAFMHEVELKVKEENNSINNNSNNNNKNINPPEIISSNDFNENIDDYKETNTVCYNIDSDDERVADDVDYDSDGIPILESLKRKPSTKEIIQPLQQIDHSTINYIKFRKNFYKEHTDVKAMSDEQISQIRKDLNITLVGNDIPRPISEFNHSLFDKKLLFEIKQIGLYKPTPIQCQGIPIALSGRDMIGLANTGSGKTYAYIWPMIVHILDQPNLKFGEGPISLILAPTRELVTQIFNETKKFAKIYNINVCPVYGGAGKYEMSKALKSSPEIVIATPGRLIEFIRLKHTNLMRVSLVILDEADKLFELGFEYQIKSILNNIQINKQVLLYSATMKKKIESFIYEFLSNPIRLVVGTIGQANSDINQIVQILPSQLDKIKWLYNSIDIFLSNGKILIFALNKLTCVDLTNQLNIYYKQRQLDIKINYLHGDIDQNERSQIIKSFKGKELDILIATDVASRGLDIKNVSTVINYDIAKNIDTYIHRIGRTGRLTSDGVKPGDSYILLCEDSNNDRSFAIDLIINLHNSKQLITNELITFVENDPKAYRIRYIIDGSKKPTSSRLSSGKVGLGLNNNKAMTSEMMANQTIKKGSIVTNDNLMKFDKVYGITSTNTSTTKNTTNNISNNSSNNQILNSSNNSISSSIKGFVKSSHSLSSVNNPTSNTTNNTSNEITRKKSRWDT